MSDINVGYYHCRTIYQRLPKLFPAARSSDSFVAKFFFPLLVSQWGVITAEACYHVIPELDLLIFAASSEIAYTVLITYETSD